MADSRADFVTNIYNAALNAGLSDAAARVMASQAAIESRWGQAAPGNNLFGIKAGASWKGPTKTLTTKEIENGKTVTKKQVFRAYASPEEAIADRIKVMERSFPGFNNAATVGDALDALKNGKYGAYYTDSPRVYERNVNSINAKYLGGSPVPPAPLTAQAPVPATMSRELAYARGLDNPADALAAIRQQIGSSAPANQGIASAYTAPVTLQLPMPKPDNWADFYSSVGIAPPKTDTSAFQPGQQNLPPPPAIPNREDPFETIFRQRREAFDLQNVPFASDAALKRMAGDKGQNILDTLAGSDWQMPTAPAQAPAATSPFGGVKYDPAEALATLAMSKPRMTLSDIMGTPIRQSGTIRYPGLAGSNEQPLAERPSSVGPAPAKSPLLDWAAGRADAIPTRTDVSAFAPRPQALPPQLPRQPNAIDAMGPIATYPASVAGVPTYAGAPRLTPEVAFGAPDLRSVSNLIAPPQPTVPAGTGIDFGMTPAGALPGAIPTAPVQQANPFVPQTFFSPTPETPAVNRKGYYQGNPMGNYEVGRGQTLAKIAKQFNTSVDTLANVNNIPNPNKVSAGAKLFVPQLATAPVAARSGSTATPTGGTVTPAQRTAISSSSGGSSTPVSTYKAPTAAKPATTSQPVSLYNPVVKPVAPKPATATTPTGSTITQAQMNAIRGLATGGPVQHYATGSAVLDWSGGADYYKNLTNALNTVNAAKTVATMTPIGAIVNAVAPSQVQTATWNAAQAIAAPKSGTSSYTPQTNMEKLAASGWSPSMMEGSAATTTSISGTHSGNRTNTNTGTAVPSSSAPMGGINNVIGAYNPPTQAQIDALYAPYFRAAQFPPAGYEPGVSGEFNYFPQVAAPAAPASTPAPQSSWLSKAADWYKSYSGSLGSRSSYDAAKQVKAPDGTSLYTLYKQFRDSLGRGSSPTLGAWQSWLTTKGYATGGAVSEPRLVLGQGGPTADKIPARIDGVQEARLSNGEFVMTAAAVRGLGNGDYKRGAEALMRLNDQFAPRKDKGTLKVEKVR